eukprot:XP_015580790.1 FRIGIDA-like protein 1 isoform X2 [Ricinus communis]
MSSSNSTQMTTLKTIESALNLIDIKKQTLKRAYDDLQSHSSLLSSFSLSWSDLDSHFTSVQTALTRRFLRLQSTRPGPETVQPEPVQDNPTRKALVPFCEKMDGRGLRDYISEHSREREAIRAELVGLMGLVSDPGEMILDAMEGFYLSKSKGDRDVDLYRLRKSCLDLLEVLSEIKPKPKFSDEVKIKAKNLAFEWKEKVSLNGDSPSEALGFLNLIVAFELKDMFDDVNELLNYFVVIARFKQATVLARDIGLGDKINDLVQKLIDSGKQLLAVKFIFEFGLTDKFQPAPLLRDHLKESKEFTDKVCKEEKNSVKNEARSREVNALKSVLRYIDEHNLEFDYPHLDLEKRIEMLEKQKADRKVAAPSPDNRPRQQPKKQQLSKKQQQHQGKQQAKKQQLKGNKRPRMAMLPGPAAVPISIAGPSSAGPPFQHSHLPQAGLLPAAGPYGLVSSTPPIGSYAGASAGPYGLAGAGMCFPGNPSPVRAHPYSSNSHMSSSYYDRSAAFGGYGFPPQYCPGYYPQ